MEKQELVKLCSFWEKYNKDSEQYWSGNLGRSNIVIYKNSAKQEMKDPDLLVYMFDKKETYIPMFGLWIKTSAKTNSVYYTGALDRTQVFAFRKMNKVNEKQPDLDLFICNKKSIAREENEEAPRFQDPPIINNDDIPF